MELLIIKAPDIIKSAGGLTVGFKICKSAETIAKKCQRLLPKDRFLVPELMDASHLQATITLVASPGTAALTDQCLKNAIDMVIGYHTDYVHRYDEGYSLSLPVKRKPSDPAVECLNKVIWILEQEKVTILLAPGQRFEERLKVVAPEKLLAAVPVNKQLVAIKKALIIGCREIHGNQRDLFQSEADVEVIVSLVGAVSEVRLSTTRDKAQQLYQGTNRLTAEVSIQGYGHIPRVVDPLIT